MAHRLRREELSFVDRAPIRTEQRVDVACSLADLWPAIADASQWPRWFPGVAGAHYTSEPPHGVGSTRWVDLRGIKVDEEVLAFEEPTRFAFTVLEANVPGLSAMVEAVTLAPTPGGTRVTYRQALELSGWMRPVAPLVRRQLTSGLRAGLDGLARWQPGT